MPPRRLAISATSARHAGGGASGASLRRLLRETSPAGRLASATHALSDDTICRRTSFSPRRRARSLDKPLFPVHRDRASSNREWSSAAVLDALFSARATAASFPACRWTVKSRMAPRSCRAASSGPAQWRPSTAFRQPRLCAKPAQTLLPTIAIGVDCRNIGRHAAHGLFDGLDRLCNRGERLGGLFHSRHNPC